LITQRSTKECESGNKNQRRETSKEDVSKREVEQGQGTTTKRKEKELGHIRDNISRGIEKSCAP